MRLLCALIFWVSADVNAEDPINQTRNKVLDVVGPEHQDAIDKAAINGILSAIEKQTGLSGSKVLSLSEKAEERSWQAGIRQGYGLRVQLISGRGFYVDEVIVDSPAAAAGIQTGDIIVSIAGRPMTALPPEQMVELLQQSFEHAIAIEVMLAAELHRFTIEKGVFQISMLTVREQSLGLEFFGEGVSDALRSTIMRIGNRPLVLDLRDNEGGLWDEGIACLELFLPAEQVLGYRRSINGVPLPIVSHQPMIHDQPLIVLINGGTKGPAELFAIALKQHGRARLIGEPSAGVSVDFRYENLQAGLLLKLADAELLAPNQSSWSGRGVLPDVVLSARGLHTPAPLRPFTPGLPSALDDMQDPQLNKAIQLISVPEQ